MDPRRRYGGRLQARSRRNSPACLLIDRMQINWFSPLLVCRTDVAHYTARVLPALAARAEVTLWTDEPTWEPSLERYAHVRHFSAKHLAWSGINRADVNVYQIGNN